MESRFFVFALALSLAVGCGSKGDGGANIPKDSGLDPRLVALKQQEAREAEARDRKDQEQSIKLAQAINKLVDAKVCDVEWHHPAGSTSENPKQLLVVVAYYHRVPKADEVERKAFLRKTFDLIVTLSEHAQAVYVEGASSREIILPATGSKSDLVRILDEAQDSMTEIRVLSARLHSGVELRGAENPYVVDRLGETASRLNRLTIDSDKPAQLVFRWYEGKPERAKIVRTPQGYSDGVRAWSEKEVDILYEWAETVEEVLDTRPSAAFNLVSCRAREDYLATFPRRSLVLFGAEHGPNFKRYADKRSVAVLEVKGLKQARPTTALKEIQTFLNALPR